MGLRSRVANWLFKTVDKDSDLLGTWDSTAFSLTNFRTLSREGYEHVATVFRAVNLVAKTAATIMMGVFEDGDDGPELIQEHTFPVMMRRPNDLMGRATFIKFWVTSLLLGGRAFIWANKSEFTGEILELWVLPPSDVEVQWGEVFGTIVNFHWHFSGGSMVINPEDVLFTQFPNPRDPLLPISPLQAAAQEVDLSNQGLKWNLSLLVNSAKPPFYIALPKDSEHVLKTEHVNEIKAALRDDYSGSSNVGKAPVFKIPGLQLIPYGWTPQDIDWLKGLQTADIRIANVFDVPPELVGAQKTYENFKEANRALYDQAVIPLMELLADELTNWKILGLEENQFIGLLLEKIKALQEDQTLIATREVSLVGAGIKTRNESRSALKLPKSGDPMADVLTVGTEVTTLGVSGLGMGTEGVEEESSS